MARRSFTEVPYQYGDGKFGVAVGQTRNGVEELITLAGSMVWDSAASLWVPVSAAKPLPVGGSPDGSAAVALKTTAAGEVIAQLSGRIVKYTATVLSTTPLLAGQSYTSPDRDLTQDSARLAYGLMVKTSTFSVLALTAKTYDGAVSNNADVIQVGVWPNFLTWVPPFRPPVPRFSWTLRNPTTSDQSYLTLHELATDYLPYHPTNMRAVLCYNLQIRDGGKKTPSNSPANMSVMRRIVLGGAKSPIVLNNGLSVEANVNIVLTMPGVGSGVVHTANVPAASIVYITNAAAPALDAPWEELSVEVTAPGADASTTGAFHAVVDTLVGGSA